MTEDDQPVSDYRDRLVQRLDEAIVLIDRHSSPDASDWTEEDAEFAVSVLNETAAVFQAPLEHLYWREVAGVSGESEPFPALPTEPVKLRAHQIAAAGLFRRLPSILPHKLSEVLAHAFRSASEGDAPDIFQPTKRRGRGQRQRQQSVDALQRTLSKTVWHYAGAHSVGITAARAHFAEVLDVEPRSVERWDEHTSQRERGAAFESGTAGKSPKWLHDNETLAAAYRDLIATKSRSK